MSEISSYITLRRPEAMAYLRVTRYTFSKLVQQERIPVIRAGRLQLFRQAALDAYLQEHPHRRRRRQRVQKAMLPMEPLC